MSFNDSLLETQGFENRYLIDRLGRMMIASINGRLKAIAKRRTGAIDAILREIPDHLRVAFDIIGETGMSIVDWDVAGIIDEDSKEKCTYSVSFYSELQTIMGRAVTPTFIAAINMLEQAPVFTDSQAVELDDDDDDDDDIDRHDLLEHPIYQLIFTLVTALMTHSKKQFECLRRVNDVDDGTVTWYFSWAPDVESPAKYLVITINEGLVLEEVKMVTG